MANRFPYLSGNDLSQPQGVWGWAKRLVDELNNRRIADVAVMSLVGNAGKVIKVKADESGYELSSDLTGGGGAGIVGEITVDAGETLGGNRAVRIGTDNMAYYGDPTLDTCRLVAGLTTGAASVGNPVTVQTDGIMTEASWNWVGTEVVWLTGTGQLTQTPPATGYLMQVGVPLGPDRLRIEPQLVAILP